MDPEPRERRSRLSIAETICEATAHAADDLDLRGIALFTESGSTARQLSKYHPTAPIFALSPVEVTVNRLNLLWGTTPIRCPKVNTTEAMVDCAEKLLEKGGYVRPREVIAIVAGTRTKSGSTNFMRLHVMGENTECSRYRRGCSEHPRRQKTRGTLRAFFRSAETGILRGRKIPGRKILTGCSRSPTTCEK